MRVLLELGADPMLPNFNNTTPLMAAAGLGTTEPLEEAGEEAEALEATKMLLDLGADVNAVDNDGSTAMHGAAYGAYSSVVTLLAERGADPQIWKERNKAGVTPLFAAEGYIGRLPRPDKPTIEAVTKLMRRRGFVDGRRAAADRGHLRKTARADQDEQGQSGEARQTAEVTDIVRLVDSQTGRFISNLPIPQSVNLPLSQTSSK